MVSLLVPLLAACGSGAGERPIKPEVWQVSAEPVVTIGESEGDARTLFSDVAQAALLPHGRVAVADRQADGIRIFREDGTFDREIGARGEGPGEFQYVSALAVLPPDTLLVHDGRLFRLSRFLTDGTLLSTLALQASDGSPEVYLGTFSTGELGFGWIRVGRRDVSRPVPDEMSLARFSTDGRMSALLGTTTGMVRFGRSPLAFSPHLWVAMIGDSLFLTDGLPPAIEVWDLQGRVVRTIRVAVPTVEATAAWSELERELSGEGNEWQRARFEEQPKDVGIPGLARILVDDRKRLWVKLYEPRADSHLLDFSGAGGEWWVVEPGGAVVAGVRLPDGFQLRDVRDDRLLGVIRDEVGVQRVQVFDLRRPDGAS